MISEEFQYSEIIILGRGVSDGKQSLEMRESGPDLMTSEVGSLVKLLCSGH